MYNVYKKGTDAHYAFQDFVGPIEDIQSAAENACGMIDELQGQVEEAEAEVKDLQQENDELRDKANAIDVPQTLELFWRIHTASVALTRFAEEVIKSVEKAYGLESSSLNNGAGAGSDGSGQDSDGKGAGEAPA